MSPPAFNTEVAPVPGVPEAGALHLKGRVTYEEAPELRRSILEELARTAAAKVVLELGGIDEMDTSGAAVLAEALKFGQQRGLRVLLCSPSESVLRIFRLAGFEDVLGHCCRSTEETVQRLLE